MAVTRVFIVKPTFDVPRLKTASEKVRVTKWLDDEPENISFLTCERERILQTDPKSDPEVRLDNQRVECRLALFRHISLP
jgi:hypothetical protein